MNEKHKVRNYIGDKGNRNMRSSVQKDNFEEIKNNTRPSICKKVENSNCNRLYTILIQYLEPLITIISLAVTRKLKPIDSAKITGQ